MDLRGHEPGQRSPRPSKAGNVDADEGNDGGGQAAVGVGGLKVGVDERARDDEADAHLDASGDKQEATAEPEEGKKREN